MERPNYLKREKSFQSPLKTSGKIWYTLFIEMQRKKGEKMRTEKPAVKFELEYRADVLLRNRPDGRFGIRGEVKNRIVVLKDGTICLDFQSDIFPCPPLAVREEEQAARFLRTLGNFVEKYVAHHGISSPPYLDYIVNFFRLFLCGRELYKICFGRHGGGEQG